jgi:hypothetical protein
MSAIEMNRDPMRPALPPALDARARKRLAAPAMANGHPFGN